MPTQAPGFMSMVPDVDCLFLAQPAANSDNSPMGFTLQRRIIKKRKNVDLDFPDLNQKILQKKVCAAEKFSIPVTSFVTSVASFVPDVTSFVPDVASFIPDVASFVTSVASFDTSVASFVTDVAGFSNSVSNHLSYRSIKESIGRQRRIF
jgi:hypothetical protein